MAQDFIEASSLNALRTVLNGGVRGGVKLSNPEGKVQGLHGLALVVNGNTVNFSDPTGAGIPLIGTGSIKALIEAGVAGSTVSYDDGRIIIEHASGVTIAVLGGTANFKFGFSKNADTVGTVYAPPDGAAPRVLAVSGGARGDSYFAHVETV
jgi:hypothetical protein